MIEVSLPRPLGGDSLLPIVLTINKLSSIKDHRHGQRKTRPRPEIKGDQPTLVCRIRVRYPFLSAVPGARSARLGSLCQMPPFGRFPCAEFGISSHVSSIRICERMHRLPVVEPEAFFADTIPKMVPIKLSISQPEGKFREGTETAWQPEGKFREPREVLDYNDVVTAAETLYTSGKSEYSSADRVNMFGRHAHEDNVRYSARKRSETMFYWPVLRMVR
jgi:hypothetical protein